MSNRETGNKRVSYRERASRAWIYPSLASGAIENIPRGLIQEPFDAAAHAGNMVVTPGVSSLGAYGFAWLVSRFNKQANVGTLRAAAYVGAVAAGALINAWTETKTGQKILPLPEFTIFGSHVDFTPDPSDLAWGVAVSPIGGATVSIAEAAPREQEASSHIQSLPAKLDA